MEAFGGGGILPDDENTFASLLSTISSATKGQLSKLFLNISESEGGAISVEALTNVMMKTAGVLEGPLFKEIRWVVPYAISAISKNANNSRVFSVEKHPNRFPPIDASAFRIFLREMVRFTGGGLTKLSIDSNCIEFNNNEADPQGSLGEILCEIQKSQQSMEDLDIYVPFAIAFEVFQVVETFSRLSSLQLTIDQDRVAQLSLPRGSPSFHLKKLDLSLPHTTGEMGWLVGWIGKDLESLRICFSSSTPFVTKLPKSVLSSIFETCLSLKSLDLSGMMILSDSSSSSTELLTLPTLESLSIGSLCLAGYEIFAKCSMPRLESLSFSAGPGRFVDKETASQLMEHLLMIVKLCRSTLAKLSLDRIIQSEAFPFEPQNVSKIALSELKDLTIRSSDVTALQFLQGFKFQLNRLSLSDSTASIQSIYQLFLEPNSQTLEDITLSGEGKGSETALINIKNNKVSFPKLKSLLVGSGNSHNLVEAFAGAVFGELANLELCNTSDLPFPKSVASLLATSAFALTRLQLYDYYGGLYEKTDFDNPELEFANLVDLSISGTLFSPLQLLLKSSFPKLSNLYIHCPTNQRISTQSEIPIRQVLNLLESCAPTIKDVSLFIKDFDKTEDFQHQVSFSFPRMTKFICFYDLDFLGALADMDPLSLSGLSSEERLERIKEKLLEEIAPRLSDGLGQYTY